MGKNIGAARRIDTPVEVAKKDLATSDTVAALEKRVCNTYLVLAEISVESGNFGQAVEDLKVCLERQKVALFSICFC